MPQHRKRRPFPTREQIADFVRQSPREVGFREIARAFGITGRERETLKSIVRELERDQLIGSPRHRRRGERSGLPPVGVLDVIGVDDDGDVLARPQSWPEDRPPPRIYLVPSDRRSPAPTSGDRVLARLSKLDDGTYEARVMRRLERAERDVVGIFALVAGHGRVQPTNRRIKTEFTVAHSDSGNAQSGDLVRAEILPGRRHGMPQARIVERLGPVGGPGSASMIAVAENEIPTSFTPAALDLARRASAAPLDDRVGLRDVALITIDGADARDFDDAIWAEPDAENPGGWHLMVAIADVAWYVRPGDALDQIARERGNSVYFPDRVVPMLPEELSNGWCSLKPGEDRPCLVAELWIDPNGRLVRHRFVRAMMRSAARLTYEQVQRALDGADDAASRDLIEPLDGAYRALNAARTARGTLDLDLPERRFDFASDGSVAGIGLRHALDSHRLIEEFMIAANVAAAETLGMANRGGLFRVHDTPAPEKVDELRELLATFDIRIAKGQVIRPSLFRGIVERVRGTALAPVVQNAVLRSQAKAVYSPRDTGHFGLALRNYAHFTSPIRRYADLEVHRALIAALNLGQGGAIGIDEAALELTAEHISMTERRAARAERDAADRLCAEFLSDRLDAEFDARIVDAIRSAIFVRLNETGAEGLLPLSHAGDERFRFDPARRGFVGMRSREWLRPGDPIRVRLIDADRMTGSLVFARVSIDG